MESESIFSDQSRSRGRSRLKFVDSAAPISIAVLQAISGDDAIWNHSDSVSMDLVNTLKENRVLPVCVVFADRYTLKRQATVTWSVIRKRKKTVV